MDLNASMSRCGSLRTNPTVSVSRIGWPPGSSRRRGGGVERGEELVLHVHVRARELLEQAGLARVGVADDGGVRHGQPLPLLALGGALAAHFRQFGLEHVDAFAHEAAVGFELALALALAADALLAAEVPPGAGEARQRIFHAREFDLEPRFLAARAAVEDVQDHLLAVDDRQAAEFLPFALLAGGEFVVENDHVALQRPGLRHEFPGLARADEVRRLRTVDLDQHAVRHRQPERIGQLGQFVEQAAALFRRLGLPPRADEQRARDVPGFLDDGDHGARQPTLVPGVSATGVVPGVASGVGSGVGMGLG